ncbi:DUF4431 domain-containing protein [Lichenibacterium minor]|uniref:DUF4431 domain-containing protein n=1 Tax=Lichenibacterium minor TaxID=2316528 RepID=A0A4Q2TYY1_9HYPH|nr:DUF4431 domain-containing protein [Lichenibacterium minor]RYC28930.1 DUF4431 domain-containing protein [Lichenibacterium minor]
MRRLALVTFMLVAGVGQTWAACRRLDLDARRPQTLSGMLTFKVFPGAPEFRDVRSGDQPEPSYILVLDDAVCATGGDLGRDVSDPTTSVHLLPLYDGDPARVGDALRADKGRHVTVTTGSIDLSTTGHHHAPLIADVTAVELDGEGMPGMEQPGTTTVRGFYTALSAGDGAEAARFVLPDLRVRGPLSAAAMSVYYSALVKPLSLRDVRPLTADTFEATYGFTSRSGACDGRSVVTTVRRGDLILISRIRSLSGC